MSKEIDHIIFDLGGVLYEINFDETLNALKAYVPEMDSADKILGHPVFKQLERGEHTPESFYADVRSLTRSELSDEQIESIWNALLRGIFPGREEDLARLRHHYDMVLLSNTNEIHRRHFEPLCKNLFCHLDNIYYSHELRLRKPDPEIFREVIRREKYNPSRTLFVDDSEANLEGAREAGLKTFLIKDEEDWKKLMNLLEQSA